MNRRPLSRRISGAAAMVLLASGAVALSTAPAANAVATIAVTTTAAGVDETDGKCSLSEAIQAANYNAAIAIKSTPPDAWVTTECTPGTIGADTIVLQAGATYTFSSVTDDLYNPMGPTATPIVFSPITIEGRGARLQRAAAAPPMRAFAVGYAYVDADPGPGTDIASGTGDLVLRNVYVKDFFAKGGNGGNTGGGGLGAGGAIYVREASLTVENSTFEGNRAEGGNGGLGSHIGGGGGGGGLGGDGGFASGQVYDEYQASGGGGGGGSRGDGGDSISTGDYGFVKGGRQGGGGGGTVTDGGSDDGTHLSRAGGEACGGDGGYFDDRNGYPGSCPGGGGGGGERPYPDPFGDDGGEPGDGAYGGGGGGGGYVETINKDKSSEHGGHGGFGGGGGGAGTGSAGGDAGFGAGGGGGTNTAGQGGTFGGDGGVDNGEFGFDLTGPGGGGAGLGGAIFGDDATIEISNSTFTGNSVSRGIAGAGGVGADKGADAGAAVFGVDGDISIDATTIAFNESTGSGAGVVVYRSTRSGRSAALALRNTIIARNDITPGVDECYVLGSAGGSVSTSGTGNLMTNNGNCPGVASTADPALGALAVEVPGLTPTLPIDATSSAFDTGDDATCLATDQRGVSRPRSLHCDIGAYEYVKPEANLAVATTRLDTAIAGQDLSFLVQAVNNGPTAASSVVLTDTIPSGTTFVGITGSGGMSCAGTTSVVCTLAVMPEGSTALLTLTVHLPASMANGTALTNAVSITSSTPDPVPSNNSASVATTAVTRADVAVAVTGPTAPVAGTDITYSVTVANGGPSNASTVGFSQVLPSVARFASLTSPSGWSCTTPAVGSAGTVACTTSSMTPSASATFTLVARLAASAPDTSQVCGTATATTSTTDPVAGNNSGTTCGTVRTLADLAIGQTATTSGKPGKGTATFTVRVTNNGPSDSQNVLLDVSSSLFVGPAPSTITTAGGTCVVSGQTVSCSWTTLAAGAIGQVVISIPWRSSVGSMCITDAVRAGTTDPNPLNDKGGICTAKK